MSRGTVLVPGITGFIGTHIALAFLEVGYTVKATSCTAAKAEDWIARFPAHKAHCHYAVVVDIAAPGAFDDPVKGYNIIAHIRPLQPNRISSSPPSAAPRTSSSRQKTNPESSASSSPRRWPPRSSQPGSRLAGSSQTYDEAKVATIPPVVYRASKALAETTFWDHIEEEKPTWVGTTIGPCATLGPPIQPTASIYKDGVPATGPPVYVAASDVALAHVRAVELDATKNQRYLLIGGSHDTRVHNIFLAPEQIVDIVQRRFPELRANLPPVDLWKVWPSRFKFDTSKAQWELGITFTPLVVDTVTVMLSLAKQLNT
ncbi:hypothetical protein B0H10DRAFT_2220791 [Mycena sp. CBHHK59/15]|nr:hypothetical protein B0H10DRAFT_2238162 [Mycena sp. CBHHK59/15]KAJ6614861.1 hypothetical protein B0H10DRAFT_2220791 [Mycena sp. CBHHK59/15]